MDPSQAWIETLTELRAAGKPCAVVVVTAVEGSAPRDPGTRMIVCDGRLAWGTIGGGNLEQQAIEHAAALLRQDRMVSESVDYPLGEKVGQCCGGKVTLFYETHLWRRRTVAIFGAGHVGQALGNLAPWMEAEVLLIDPRDEDELHPSLPLEDARPFRLITTNAPEAELATLPSDALVLVMTHSHPLDLEVLVAALRRGCFPFVGLIGSARKWARFRSRLEQRGLPRELIDTVHCPIGVSRASKHPSAIALSAATQLVDTFETLEARAAELRRAGS